MAKAPKKGLTRCLNNLSKYTACTYRIAMCLKNLYLAFYGTIF